MTKITAETVTKDQWIEDQYGQKCVVEYKDEYIIHTRRCDNTGFWKGKAKWTHAAFNARRWHRARPSTRKRPEST